MALVGDDKRRDEETLRESEARYRSVVEDQTEFIVRWLPDGTRTFVNESYCRFFRQSRAELIGTSFFPLIREEDREAVWAKIASLTPENPVATAEHRVHLPDGSIGWQQWTDRAFFRDGKIVELQSVGRDITEKMRLEEQAERQRVELARAEKMISLGTLVSGIAHEINNPNQFILLNIELLADIWRDAQPILEEHFARHPELRLGNLPFGELREEVPALLAEVGEGAQRIKQLVSELRAYSQDGGAQPMRPVAVGEAVRSALTLLAGPIKKATRRFSVDLGEDVPPVAGNLRRLEQVILNLILNACQALTDPEQAVRVATSFDRGSGRVEVRVEDEGQGIPEERLARIFDPFYTTRRDRGGSGLGLAVAARIVDEHQGSLTIDSEAGRGTVARLLLPAQAEGEGEKE